MSNKIQTLGGYIHEYQKSVQQPEQFWARIAESFLLAEKAGTKWSTGTSRALMYSGLSTAN